MSRIEQEYISSQQLQDLPEPLSLPHFDEEATLLSARPVVPLHEVRAVTRSKRRLLLSLTIVAAMLAGGIAATLLFTPRENPIPDVTQDNSVGATSPSSQESGGLAVNGGQSPVDQTVESQDSTSSSAEQSDVQSTTVTSSKKSKVNKVHARNSVPDRPRRVNSEPGPVSSASQSEAEDAENLEFEERMLRREERREARRLRRERRNGRERSSDDLMRIREIFEGTPRP